MLHECVRFQFDRRKFKEMVLYICAKCEASNLGSVKLHKTLYFSDMLRYAWNGSPISGETYQKSPLGPTSRHLHWTLKQLESEQAINVRTVDYFGYRKQEYIAKRNPETSYFSGDELSLMDEIIDFVCKNNTAKDVSALSHTRAWELAAPGAEIPYHTAFLIFPQIVSAEAFEWAKSTEAEIEAERSKSDPLGYPPFADFRARVLARRAERA
jgi:Antitoxin SocA-like, Panacea domain